MKIESIDWEKIFVPQVFDKGLVSGIHKDLLQINNKKGQPNLKMGKLLEHTSQNINKWLISTWKDNQKSSAKHRLKPPQDTTECTHTIVTNIKRLKIPNMGKKWTNWESYILPIGAQNGMTILKIYLAVSFMFKYTPALWLSNSNCSYLFKRKKNICPQKDLYSSIQRSFICNSQNPEITQISISIWMNTFLCNNTVEYYLTVKKKKK